MKAVILAGGEGKRLRPLSLSRPKALLPLPEGVVLSRCLEALKEAGVNEVFLSLGHQAEQIEAWCAAHPVEGMTLRCRREDRPLGAAGAVRALLEELGEEDFLVLPGDVVFDFDLKELLACHQTSRSAATIALKRWEGVPECGMVVTDAYGRVERFVEKPGWDQVLSGTVNTGVYVLTRRAAEKIPSMARWDFARNLFPVLLELGEVIGSQVMEGFWRDLDSPEGYLDCVERLLAGKGGMTAPKIAPGVWSRAEIPDSVQVVPPCWFDEGVTLGEGALIGPHVALGRDVSVGRRTLVQRSVLMEGARVGDRATLYGAILGRGASAEDSSVLNEGSILADHARAGEGVVLAEGTAVWPGREVPAGTRLNRSLTAQADGLGFGDGGVLRGVVGESLTPESFTALGVVLGGNGKVALGWSGGDGAAMLARSLGAGVCAGGGAVLAHDGCCPACAAWLGEYYGVSDSLFVEQEGERVFLHWFDERGLPPGRERVRRVERQWNAGSGPRAGAGQVGAWERLAGINTAYAADAARRAAPKGAGAGVTVAVPGEGAWDQALSHALERMGCRVARRPLEGAPALSAAHGGFWLEGRTEEDAQVDSAQMLALAALLELERSGVAAVSAAAPAVIDALGGRMDARVLRLGRDRGAEQVYAKTPWLRDALFAAVYLAAAMGREGKTLAALLSRLPPFALCRAEIPLRGERGELMEAFTGRFRRAEPAGTGVRLRAGAGWVTVAPLIRRRAVRLQTEGASAEIAQELCGFYEDEIRRLDRG